MHKNLSAATSLWLLLACAPGASGAAEIGHMTPPPPVTDARIAALPPSQQASWRAYLAQSRALAAADKAALAAERGAGPVAARHVADQIVSFQTPAGGWGKNVDRRGPLRQRGQNWVATGASYVGTIDNNATTTELRFLARVQARTPGADGARYRDSFLKGLRYLFQAQYPNGGFPQIYPLEGGYHDAITFNDDALVDVAGLFQSVAARQGDYAFVPPAVAGQARDAVDKVMQLILATQVTAGGVRTAWGQQHDALTLAPVGARNFEPTALVSRESGGVLMFLMALPAPSPQVVSAVHAGAAWLKRAALLDIAWTAGAAPEGRRRVASQGDGPIWSRYYDLATMRPIFGDRDRSIHDDVNELSLERRNGYGWYGSWPTAVLAAYETWSRAHPQAARP
jgi:PelA/Pel-15E family pectate lyase